MKPPVFFVFFYGSQFRAQPRQQPAKPCFCVVFFMGADPSAFGGYAEVNDELVHSAAVFVADVPMVVVADALHYGHPQAVAFLLLGAVEAREHPLRVECRLVREVLHAEPLGARGDERRAKAAGPADVVEGKFN